MRWPVCQTPPRVVTHRIWVENPNRTVSQRRSASRSTPTRPSSHQHIPTPAAGEDRVDAGLQLVRGKRADERDERHERDGWERRERHVVTATDRNDVVGSEPARRSRFARGGMHRRGRTGRRVPRRNRGSRASRCTAETATMARPTMKDIEGRQVMRPLLPWERSAAASVDLRAARPTNSVAMSAAQNDDRIRDRRREPTRGQAVASGIASAHHRPADRRYATGRRRSIA